ncbi:MAG: SCO family protein, partial [Pseudomonadota bacterium]
MQTVQIGGAAFILGGIAAAALALMPTDPFRDCRDARIAGLEDLGGPFALRTESGALITDSKLFEEPSLVYFGYTFCPDMCPLDNARNAEAAFLLADQGIKVQTVFVSVDPARDTLERLREYTDAFSEEMLGLTGTPDQIKGAADAYDVFYAIPQAQSDDDYYLIDHSTH